MPRPKILIVDDSQVDADTIRRYLASENVNEYHVMTASTGDEGLDLAATFKPDVVLLDFDLPDMDGLEFLRELPERLTRGEEPPVVLAVTGQSDPRVAAELIRGGAEDYIGKGQATPDSVRLAVRQAARTRALRSALAERARERERSRQELIASLERASFVASFSEALSRSLSLDAVLSAVAQLAVPALADVCFVDLLEDGNLMRRCTKASGAFEMLANTQPRTASSMDGHEGAAKVLRSGAPATYARSWLSALSRWDADIEQAAKLGHLESAIVVPLIFDAAPLGALTLLSGRRLDGYAQDVAGELGRRASAALANARAFEAERAAKRASDEARLRLALLSSVSDVFSRSLEWREAVREVIAIVVPAAADYASISLVENGEMQVVASSTDNVYLRPTPLPARRPGGMQSEYYPDVSFMRRYTDADRTLHAIGDESGGSFIRVPITSPSGATIGDFSVSTSGQRRLTLDDLGLAEDIGRRIGLYIETARAFERERDIAHSLQKSLLPSGIPLVPGVEFAARCIAGATGVEVGGDWFDIIALREGYVAFAVGDVAGRGVLAAATMGQMRSSLRAYVLEGLGPAEALARLNAFIMSQEHMEFATVGLGLLHCATGRLRYASAGHLPPILIDRERGARIVAARATLPVGVLAEQQFTEECFDLVKGQALALFTDGLVESRSKDIEHGTADLVEALGRSVTSDDMLQRALELVPVDLSDDVTFLALRYLGVGAEAIAEPEPRLLMTLPAVPKSASIVREHLLHFCEAAGLDATRRFDLQLAVGEAVANAVEHAYDGRDEEIFSVHARIEKGRIVVDVLDQGRWREGVRTPRGQLSERGRGVGLMRSLCDEVRIERTLVGTRIQLGLIFEQTEADGVFA